MDNVWFCKLLFLFEIEFKPDIGFEKHLCACVSVMEEYDQSQVLYVIPITSMLGRLALVLMGDNGTIPYSMLQEASTFPGAASQPFCPEVGNQSIKKMALLPPWQEGKYFPK